jgi:two-component system response regulator AtoC
VFRLDLPPLRTRLDDIPLLAQHFTLRRSIAITSEALARLANYDWPGNVRELENVLERAAIVCGGRTIDAAHLPADIAPSAAMQPAAVPMTPENLSIPLASETLEKQLIAEALRQTGNNKSKAARLLDISERSLWYKLTRYNLG